MNINAGIAKPDNEVDVLLASLMSVILAERSVCFCCLTWQCCGVCGEGFGAHCHTLIVGLKC